MKLISYSVIYRGPRALKQNFFVAGVGWVIYGTVLTVIWPHSPYREAELMTMTDRHILYRLGVHDDGDIFNEENLVEFRRFVMEATDNKGVHFVMADGVSKNSRS